MLDIRNPEGYMDPTPYEAMKKIARGEKRFMPVVYICSPYSGDVERNVERARRFCRFAVEKGCIPLAPHLLFPQFMDDTDRDERELALFMDTVLLGKCREICVLGDEVTEGMRREIETAMLRDKPVRYFDGGFKEVAAE